MEINNIDDNILKNRYDFFIKDIDGECASYVKKFHDYNEYLKKKKEMSSGSFLCQESVKQHREMSRLNPSSINTLRVVTVMKEGKPKVLSFLLRCGTSKTSNVDNWAAGGLAIGINKNGYLKKYGFFKPGYGLKVSSHPDSKISFSDFKIPFFEEALLMACKAHKYFYNIGAIGWDIAITETGPIFIEGNDNFEITLQQACDRPLRKEWERIAK